MFLLLVIQWPLDRPDAPRKMKDPSKNTEEPPPKK
jgi:hypothetical protein